MKIIMFVSLALTLNKVNYPAKKYKLFWNYPAGKWGFTYKRHLFVLDYFKLISRLEKRQNLKEREQKKFHILTMPTSWGYYLCSDSELNSQWTTDYFSKVENSRQQSFPSLELNIENYQKIKSYPHFPIS